MDIWQGALVGDCTDIAGGFVRIIVHRHLTRLGWLRIHQRNGPGRVLVFNQREVLDLHIGGQVIVWRPGMRVQRVRIDQLIHTTHTLAIRGGIMETRRGGFD